MRNLSSISTPRNVQALAAGPLLSLRRVTKIYKRGSETVEVLQALNLDIPRGDFLALMGPSGSGKTTLMNILGGIDRPTAGEVIVDGQRIHEFSDNALADWRADHVGFVFQLYHLLPALSAEQNVALPLILKDLGMRERQQRARAALAVVGLEAHLKYRPAELSGGQQQRVGIARALVTDPPILLCDEPTGDLDRRAGDGILELLQLLNSEHGKTVIMVTHDPHAAARARRTLFMTKGVLSQEPEA